MDTLNNCYAPDQKRTFILSNERPLFVIRLKNKQNVSTEEVHCAVILQTLFTRGTCAGHLIEVEGTFSTGEEYDQDMNKEYGVD